MTVKTYADSHYLQKCRELASLFLEDSDVTNADAATLKKYTELLAAKLLDQAEQFVADAETDAPHPGECRCSVCWERYQGGHA